MGKYAFCHVEVMFFPSRILCGSITTKCAQTQYHLRRKQVIRLSKHFLDIRKPFRAFVISYKLPINYPDFILKLGYPEIHLQNFAVQVAIWTSVNKPRAVILYFRSVNPSSTAKYFCLQNFAVLRGRSILEKFTTSQISDFVKYLYSVELLILEVLT